MYNSFYCFSYPFNLNGQKVVCIFSSESYNCYIQILHLKYEFQPPAIPDGYSSTLENLTYAMLQKDDFLRPTAFYVMNHQYIQSSLLQVRLRFC